MITNKRIFITGGAGFIGSTLVGKLVENNEITIFDNFRRDSLSLKSYRNHRNLRIIEGNILDRELLLRSVPQSEVFIHSAAIAGVDTVIAHPTETMRVNLLGTAYALEAALRMNKLERFVDFSTSEVFGTSAFRAEEGNPTNIGPVGEARWTYAVSKLAGEHLTKAYHTEYGLPTVTLRPFNIYGPGQVGEGAMKIFIERALNDEDIQIHGDGSQIRAWCYVDDFIEGLLISINHPNAVGESFNIGNNRTAITILGLAETTIRVLNSKSKIVFIDKPYADIELRVPNVEKAFQKLGFKAKVDMDEGISLTAQFYREHSL
ncbi:MAG: NAD-dependent epimerase/dehydratase family protein [Saccharofermentanales bacterium]|jgi:UDP-glucose 4-epimerase